MRTHHFTGHMFPAHVHGVWYRDLSLSGWIHIITMAFILGVLLVYVVSPVPKQIVILTSVLVSIHVVLGTVQPGWYCSGSLLTKANLMPPLFANAAIWGVALLKMRFS